MRWDALHAPLAVCSAQAKPSGDQFVTCGEDGMVCVCDIASGSVVERVRVDGTVVRDVAWVSDDVIASGSEGGHVRLWDVRSSSGRPPLTTSHCLSLTRHAASVPPPITRIATWSDDLGSVKALVSGDEDGCVTFWDLRTTRAPLHSTPPPEQSSPLHISTGKSCCRYRCTRPRSRQPLNTIP